MAKIAKEFSRKGCPVRAENISLAWDSASGKSKGCAYRSQNLNYFLMDMLLV